MAKSITLKELEAMRNVDPRTVDHSKLVDAETVKVKKNLPKRERILDYIEQVKNPYLYKYKGITIKVSFAGKEKVEDCITRCLSQSL